MMVLRNIMFLCVVLAMAGVPVCGEPATAAGGVDTGETGQGGRSRNQLSAQEYQERREWFNAGQGGADQSPEEEAQKRLDEKAFTAIYGDGTLKPLTWHDAGAKNKIVGELIVGPMGLVGKIKDGGVVVGPDGKRIGKVEDFIQPDRAQ